MAEPWRRCPQSNQALKNFNDTSNMPLFCSLRGGDTLFPEAGGSALRWLLLFLGALVLFLCPDAAHAQSLISLPTPLLAGTEMAKGLPMAAQGLVTGIVYGVLLTACLYLFILWTVMRDRSQVFLILLLLSIAASLGFTSNLEALSDWFDNETRAQYLKAASLILFYLFGLLFTLEFLEIDDVSGFLSRLLKLCAGAMGLLLLVAAFDSVLVNFFLPMIGLFIMGLILFAGLSALRQNVPGAGTHLLAFTIFFIGGMTQPLLDVGVLRPDFATENLFYFSSVLAALVFAVVIAGQFAKRQEEKERALATSNERFKLAAQGANEGLYDWDVEAEKLFFSDRFKKIVGKTLDGSVDSLKALTRMIYPGDRTRVRRAFAKFIRGEATSLGLEFRLVRPDNSRRWVYATGVAIRPPGAQRPSRIVGSLGDITEKKQSEVALRASETRFRGIAEAHPVPVVIIRMADSILLYASPGAESVFGAPLPALIGRSIDRFFSSVAERKSLLDELLMHRQVDLWEMTLRKADGSPLPVALSARLIDYQGRPAAVLGIYDLTERKRAEEQIAKQQQQLVQSEKMAALGGLLAGVAHELNNPLSVVMGQSVLLQETSQDPKIIQRAQKIHVAAERCARIVKSFLALARKKPAERAEVSINEVVQGAVDLLAYQLKTDTILLTLDLDEHLPSVFADADQLNQVVTNLIINARQALQNQPPPRKITVMTRENKETRMVMIRVADNGPGVPREIKSRIFEPFFTTKPAGSGTGVGLSLCHNIIETHGGRISIHDTDGGGATFVVRLPVSQNSAQLATLLEAPAAPLAPPRGKRLLLVDDELELAQTLADLLAPDGHMTDIAENGLQALEKIRQNQYDLIISDLRMPVMDGPGLYAAVCENHPEFAARMIFVTGDTLSQNVRDFLTQHRVTVIDKPYMPMDVKRAIANTLAEVENKAANSPLSGDGL